MQVFSCFSYLKESKKRRKKLPYARLSALFWNTTVILLCGTTVILSLSWSESRKDHWKLSSTRFQLKARFKDPQGQDARWNCMREAIYSSAMSAFDRIEKPSHDWLNANLPIVEPLIEAKRQALLNYKRNLWQRSSMHAVQLKALLDIVPRLLA